MWGNLDGVSNTDLDGEGICPEAKILINGNPNNPLKATQLLGSWNLKIEDTKTPSVSKIWLTLLFPPRGRQCPLVMPKLAPSWGKSQVILYVFPQKGASAPSNAQTGALLGKNMTYFTFSPKRAPVWTLLGALAPSWRKSKVSHIFYPRGRQCPPVMPKLAPSWGKIWLTSLFPLNITCFTFSPNRAPVPPVMP